MCEIGLKSCLFSLCREENAVSPPPIFTQPGGTFKRSPCIPGTNPNLNAVRRGELWERVEAEAGRAGGRPLPVDPLALAAVPLPAPRGPVEVAPTLAPVGLRPRHPQAQGEEGDEEAGHTTPSHLDWPVADGQKSLSISIFFKPLMFGKKVVGKAHSEKLSALKIS